MVRRLVESIYQNYEMYPQNRIFFIPIGNSYEGSSIVARALREVVNERYILDMYTFVRLKKDTYDLFVFLDDFCGTGSQLSDWWTMAESIVLPKEAEYIFALLVINNSARPKIEKITSVISIDELSDAYDVLSEHSSKFTLEEKTKLIEYCVATGIGPDYQIGFGECGLLLVFKHGCPDNSLPILWHSSTKWEALFKRSGL